MDHEVHGASSGRPTGASPDQEVADGGSIGGRRMVGDESRHAARGGDLAAVSERVPASCLRSVGGGLARERGERRDDRGPLRRRSRSGIPASGGSGAVSGRVSEAAGEVRAGGPSGENANDRVWSIRASQPEAAGGGKTGDVHVSGVYPLLWDELQGAFRHMATDGSQADEGEASGHQAGVAPEDA